jgi:hypothetical protein
LTPTGETKAQDTALDKMQQQGLTPEQIAKAFEHSICCPKCGELYPNNWKHACSVKFDSGAQREEQKLAYDNIPMEVLDRVAAIAYEGKVRYGADNWRKGIPIENLYSHMMEHLRKWQVGYNGAAITQEDHLAKACWNLLAIMYMEKYHKMETYFISGGVKNGAY